MSIRKVMVHPKEKWVGFFILLAVGLTLSLVLARLAGLLDDVREYRFYVRAGDIVSPGTGITFKGLKAGEVRGVRLVSDPEQLRADGEALLTLAQGQMTRRLERRRTTLRDRLVQVTVELSVKRDAYDRERKRREAEAARARGEAPAGSVALDESQALTDLQFARLTDDVDQRAAEADQIGTELERIVVKLVAADEMVARLSADARNPYMAENNIEITVKVRGAEFIRQIRRDAVLSVTPGFAALPSRLIIEPGAETDAQGKSVELPDGSLIEVDLEGNVIDQLLNTARTAFGGLKRDMFPFLKEMAATVTDEMRSRPDTIMGKVKNLMDQTSAELRSGPDTIVGKVKDLMDQTSAELRDQQGTALALVKQTVSRANDLLADLRPVVQHTGEILETVADNRPRIDQMLASAAAASRYLPNAAEEGVKTLHSAGDLLSGVKRIWPLSAFITPDPYKRRTLKYVFRAAPPAPPTPPPAESDPEPAPASPPTAAGAPAAASRQPVGKVMARRKTSENRFDEERENARIRGNTAFSRDDGGMVRSRFSPDRTLPTGCCGVAV